MRIYFLSERPCALTVNGLFLGTVDGFERTAELDPKDGCFLEFKPAGAFHPVRFCFDEQFLLDPPPNIELYFIRGGAAVYCKNFMREDAAMRVIRQERLAGTRLTLYVQGKVLLSMENETGFRLIGLPDALEDAAMSLAGENFLLEGENAFCLLSRTGETLLSSEGKILERGERIQAEIPLHDSLGHTKVCTWEGGKLLSFSLRARREPTAATYAVALFESVLAGADPAPYLAEELREKADALQEFLGPFLYVVPCGMDGEVGLVYRRKDRVFDVRYFRADVVEGKIANIAEI